MTSIPQDCNFMELVNEGARRIEQKDYKNAIPMLTLAFQEITTLIQNKATPGVMPGQPVFDISTIVKTPMNSMGNHHELMCIAPIRVPASVLADVEGSVLLVSVAAVYNLALAYHLFSFQVTSVRSRPEATAFVFDAIKLYKLSLEMQHAHARDEHSIFRLSAYSNLQQLYDFLGEGYEANVYQLKASSLLEETLRNVGVDISRYRCFLRGCQRETTIVPRSCE